MKIIIINGPNLNLLGKREKNIYGKKSFETFYKKLKKEFSKGANKKVKIEYYQSNVEGELINKIQQVGFKYDGIILNAGGYTHTSIALADCIAAVETPVIEVHISNIFAREKFRHNSLIAGKCKGSISGFGLDSYRLALLSFTI